jgi:hypothetical protein
LSLPVDDGDGRNVGGIVDYVRCVAYKVSCADCRRQKETMEQKFQQIIINGTVTMSPCKIMVIHTIFSILTKDWTVVCLLVLSCFVLFCSVQSLRELLIKE